MKIDVEGHELEVLKGAEQALERFRPYVLFESIEPAYEPPAWTREAKSLLIDRGYDLFAARGDVLVPRIATDVQEGLVTDFLAVPSEARDWCPNSYAVRSLSAEESTAWIVEDAEETQEHRRHAEAASRAAG